MAGSDLGDPRLLVFDWDGTLVDSESHIVACMQDAIADAGRSPVASAQIREIIGLGLEEAVRRLFPTEEAAFRGSVVARYRARFLGSQRERPQLFPGVAETLQELRNCGYLLAVATGKSRRGLELALAETGLGTLFRASRCADETASKPDPTMLLELMDEVRVGAKQTWVIGDTEYDMEMASRVGAVSIGVSYGVHGRERLLRWGPRVCLDAIDELPSWLGRSRTGTRSQTPREDPTFGSDDARPA